MKHWLITGANRGLGREFTRAALARGDKVAATARDLTSLADLAAEYGDAFVPLTLDVTDRAACFDVVNKAKAALGQLDVVVNNAGYGLFGMVEELTEQQLRDQMEVNFFGLFHMTQAVLPVLRSQGAGHLVQISTVGGVMTFPGLGGYHASKWAVEGLSDALSQEVAGLGIKVTLVEPGPYATDWAGASATHAEKNPAYDPVRAALAARQMPAEMYGEPVAVGPAILALVDADKPPLRLFLGVLPTLLVPGAYQARLTEWEQWKSVSVAATKVTP
ncbi:SDR family NAD(P)-dependent oxidoreductase [Rhodoferax sp. TBRC 17198]|uniref:SDR family NAD(P)-dependent oxidoreductase n=1 Tax=Rhodoferax potami TaxID=3068338 RepID=UPI0028BD3005|nr:SDR family NAD(P)-dependent oxidoreductase [Rhodoferax sp. TBRC 17198]MDT7522841.1 SDR family NAD(P)-dependent oxidoreductase [Rhodoferax sp. TBRC 17198]